jgi:murein DD-endopeptidase MepM/ murein hydrolase activator NlpD
MQFTRGFATAMAAAALLPAVALGAEAPTAWLHPDAQGLKRFGALPKPPRWVHPVDGRVGYGEAIARFGVARPGHMHAGQDVFAPTGTPLRAVTDGVVLEAGTDGGRGNYLALYSKRSGETFVYFHMLEPAAVHLGRHLRAGTVVGKVGCTGSCQGDHLHFEIREGRGVSGRAVDPLPRLRRWDKI